MSSKVFIVDKYNNPVFPGERHTKQYAWENVGTITAVVAAGQAPIDKDKRSHADIASLADAKKAVYKPMDGTKAFEFRVRADGTEDDALALQLHAEAGQDHYAKVGDYVCAQGTQAADDSAYFIDAITPSNDDWYTPRKAVEPQADNIARYALNTHGHTSFCFVCTDLKNATNIYIDVRRL